MSQKRTDFAFPRSLSPWKRGAGITVLGAPGNLKQARFRHPIESSAHQCYSSLHDRPASPPANHEGTVWDHSPAVSFLAHFCDFIARFSPARPPERCNPTVPPAMRWHRMAQNDTHLGEIPLSRATCCPSSTGIPASSGTPSTLGKTPVDGLKPTRNQDRKMQTRNPHQVAPPGLVDGRLTWHNNPN